MIIEKIIAQDNQVVLSKEPPYIYALLLVGSVVAGYFSLQIGENDNLSFGLLFFSAILAIVALKGFIFPKKFYVYKPTNEKIIKKEFYFDRQELKEVEKCLNSTTIKDGIKLLELLPKKGNNIRVICYVTKDYSYYKTQIQQYIPYEYVPF